MCEFKKYNAALKAAEMALREVDEALMELMAQYEEPGS